MPTNKSYSRTRNPLAVLWKESQYDPVARLAVVFMELGLVVFGFIGLSWLILKVLYLFNFIPSGQKLIALGVKQKFALHMLKFASQSVSGLQTVIGFIGLSGVLYNYRLTRKQNESADAWKHFESVKAQVDSFNASSEVKNVKRILEAIRHDADYPAILNLIGNRQRIKSMYLSGVDAFTPESFGITIDDKQLFLDAFTADGDGYININDPDLNQVCAFSSYPYLRELIAWQLDGFFDQLQQFDHVLDYQEERRRLGHDMLAGELYKAMDMYWFCLLLKKYDGPNLSSGHLQENLLRSQLRRYVAGYTPEACKFLCSPNIKEHIDKYFFDKFSLDEYSCSPGSEETFVCLAYRDFDLGIEDVLLQDENKEMVRKSAS